MQAREQRMRGFTLVEAVMVIVITGIIAAIVAVFIRNPVDSYIATERRAGMRDEADLAMHRMVRDLRRALPNSIRRAADGSDQCLEFMPTKLGARYRMAVDALSGLGDALDFTVVDDGFEMLWPNSTLPSNVRIAAGDVVVVYNDGSVSGSAYSGANAIQVDGVSEPGPSAGTTLLTFVSNADALPFNRKQLPSESPQGRFQVIPAAEHVVAFRCNGGVLTRSVRLLTAARARPASCAAMVAGAAGTATLAEHLGSCSLVYDPPGVSTGLSRFGLVSIMLGLRDAASGEVVTLYQQVHVENTP